MCNDRIHQKLTSSHARRVIFPIIAARRALGSLAMKTPEEKRRYQAAWQSAWRKKNPEKAHAKDVADRIKHKEKRLLSGKAYRACHKNEKSIYNKSYYLAHPNPEKNRKKVREWQKNNPEKHKALQKKYRILYPERSRARHAKWSRNNPERARVYNHKRRALNHKAKGFCSISDWKIITNILGCSCIHADKNRCNGQIHQDHIRPISTGGSCHPTNYQPLCDYHNKSKGTKYIDYRTKAQIKQIMEAFQLKLF